MAGSPTRDDQLERMLRRQPGTARGRADDCLDAETIAAWLDGGLAGEALSRAQLHVAGCSRCLAIVGSVVRSETAIEPSTTGIAARAPWFHRWQIWAFPAAAAAAAVVLWVATPVSRDAVPAVTNIARLETTVQPDGGLEPQSAGAASQPGQQTGQPGRPVESPPAPAAPAPPARQTVRDEGRGAAAVATPPAVLAEDPRAIAEQSARDTVAAAVPPNAEVAAKSAADASAPATAQQPAPVAVASPAPVSPSPPPPRQPAPLALSDTATPSAAAVAGARMREAAEPTARLVVSPSSIVRWRLTGPLIERSEDRGGSWRRVSVIEGATLLAGAAPSASVCWVVGRGGVVARSLDGVTFTRLLFPEGSDLVAATAASATTATVTDASGRIFTTADAGQSWQRR